MNLVFDRNTLRVVSLFDGNSLKSSEEDVLKSMFPQDFNHLQLWKINQQINKSPLHLSVSLDDDRNPETLFYKDAEIYRSTEKDKEKFREEKLKAKRKLLESKMPKRLLRSIGTDTIKMWVSSANTIPSVAKSLKDFQYFWDKEIMPVSWWGPFTDAGGYANMNREIVFRLHNHHVLPRIDICPTAPQISQLSQYYISKYVSFDFSRLKKYPRIWAFTPLPHPQHASKNIFFTMMETESLHPEFVRLCNDYSDEVWVPSTHNKNVFQEHGVNKPIYVMPLGIDEKIYSEEDKDIGIVEDNRNFITVLGTPHTKRVNSFRFLTLFGWSYRKGTDILIKSFVEAFNDRDDVCLIIVSRHSGSPEQSHIDVIKSDIHKYANSVRANHFPQILLYPFVIPEFQMPSIYRMGHAFIHLSRGEGFSLPQIEASACGLPVISCNNTGMSEYLRDDNSYMVTTDEKEVCSPEMHWITAYYQGQLFAKLGRPQITKAIEHMRFVLNNFDDALQKSQILRSEVFSKYTWSHAAERVAARIRTIYRGD